MRLEIHPGVRLRQDRSYQLSSPEGPPSPLPGPAELPPAHWGAVPPHLHRRRLLLPRRDDLVRERQLRRRRRRRLRLQDVPQVLPGHVPGCQWFFFFLLCTLPATIPISFFFFFFQLSTGAGWDKVWRALTDEDGCPGDEGGCGSTVVATVFVVLYLVPTLLLLVKLYPAVVLEKYSKVYHVDDALT